MCTPSCYTNHKDIGTIYFILALWSGLIGTSLSVLIRSEFGVPGQWLDDPHLYNSIITLHAFIMIFFLVTPVMIGGFGNWLAPLMGHSPNMMFAQLNNMSLWLLPPSLSLISWLLIGSETSTNILCPALTNNTYNSITTVGLTTLSIFLAWVSSVMTYLNLTTTPNKMITPPSLPIPPMLNRLHFLMSTVLVDFFPLQYTWPMLYCKAMNKLYAMKWKKITAYFLVTCGCFMLFMLYGIIHMPVAQCESTLVYLENTPKGPYSGHSLMEVKDIGPEGKIKITTPSGQSWVGMGPQAEVEEVFYAPNNDVNVRFRTQGGTPKTVAFSKEELAGILSIHPSSFDNPSKEWVLGVTGINLDNPEPTIDVAPVEGKRPHALNLVKEPKHLWTPIMSSESCSIVKAWRPHLPSTNVTTRSIILPNGSLFNYTNWEPANGVSMYKPKTGFNPKSK